MVLLLLLLENGDYTEKSLKILADKFNKDRNCPLPLFHIREAYHEPLWRKSRRVIGTLGFDKETRKWSVLSLHGRPQAHVDGVNEWFVCDGPERN